MRRYTLNIKDREFVIDVQEVAVDRFAVVVGGESYEVTLAGDETLAGAAIQPLAGGIVASPVRSTGPEAVASRRMSINEGAPAAISTAGRVPVKAGKADLVAPMPGVILEINVAAGDMVKRGQQVAILDAMKMHNVIGAPRDGIVAAVMVEAGQNVNHGDAIITYREG